MRSCDSVLDGLELFSVSKTESAESMGEVICRGNNGRAKRESEFSRLATFGELNVFQASLRQESKRSFQ
jgi:hypothetical protein